MIAAAYKLIPLKLIPGTFARYHADRLSGDVAEDPLELLDDAGECYTIDDPDCPIGVMDIRGRVDNGEPETIFVQLPYSGGFVYFGIEPIFIDSEFGK